MTQILTDILIKGKKLLVNNEEEVLLVKRRSLQNQERAERKAGKKPAKRSKYSLKGRFVSTAKEAERPAPFLVTRKGKVTSAAPEKPPLPGETTRRVTATISGIYLRRGFVLLQNETYPKIYLSDGTLTRYDGGLMVAIGDSVECDIIIEDRGPRVRNIIKIKQTA